MKLDKAFAGLIEEIGQIETMAQGLIFLRSVADLYGLTHAVYLAANVPKLTQREPYLAVTYTNDWIQHYKDMDYVSVDPVIRAGLTQMLPTDWSTFDRTDKRVRAFFGEAAEFGAGRHGMTIPIRGANGEAAMFSITSDASQREWLKTRLLYMRDFQIIANFVHEMVIRVECAHSPQAKLTARELECLKWAAVGKTCPEIALILNIGERTVRCYLDISRHKLSATNITHAVACAVSRKILDLPI